MRGLALVVVLLTRGALAAEPPPVIIPALPEPGPRAADASTRARVAYEAASKSFYAGRIEAALPHAQTAWQAVPNTSSALIVATVLAELKRPCDALPYLLLAADLDPVGDEVELVAKLLGEQAARCAPGYGWLRVSVAPDGARLNLDDVALPAVRTIGVRVGAHALRAEADGHRPGARDVVVALGGATILDVTLEPLPEPVIAPVVVPDPTIITRQPPPERDDTLPWIAVAGGGAALIAGGICFGVAIDEADHGASIVAASSTPPSAADERALARSHARTEDFELAGWIAGGVGVVALTLGIVWLTRDDELLAWQPRLTIEREGGAVTLEHRF